MSKYGHGGLACVRAPRTARAIWDIRRRWRHLAQRALGERPSDGARALSRSEPLAPTAGRADVREAMARIKRLISQGDKRIAEFCSRCESFTVRLIRFTDRPDVLAGLAARQLVDKCRDACPVRPTAILMPCVFSVLYFRAQIRTASRMVLSRPVLRRPSRPLRP